MTFNSALPAKAVPAIDLGTAATFAVLGETGVTNTGATTIVGDVGVAPGTSITGFPPGSVTGMIHNDDAAAIQAAADLGTAYTQGQGLTSTTTLTGINLGGLTLTPGVYTFGTGSALLSGGDLTLNDEGNPNAEFVFQTGTTLTTAAGDGVVLNGENGSDVFWVVGTAVTLGAGSSFEGNILAGTSITFDSGATIGSGSALAEAQVTLIDNSVSLPLASDDVPELSPSTIAAPLALFGILGLLLADRRKKAKDS